LQQLDRQFETAKVGSRLKPSEYFQRNCYVTPSSPRANELALLPQIGVDRLMFGVDFPHPEATWPNTHDWIRSALRGLPRQTVQRVLGTNAVECYGLDGPRLAALAEKIGPTYESIFGRNDSVDARKIAHFNLRSGFMADAEIVDTGRLSRIVATDIAAAKTAARV
jgi:hypothetical protein